MKWKKEMKFNKINHKTKNRITMEHVQTITRMAFRAFVITMIFIIWNPNAFYGIPIGILVGLLSEAKLLSGESRRTTFSEAEISNKYEMPKPPKEECSDTLFNKLCTLQVNLTDLEGAIGINLETYTAIYNSLIEAIEMCDVVPEIESLPTYDEVDKEAAKQSGLIGIGDYESTTFLKSGLYNGFHNGYEFLLRKIKKIK